jgi:hypothetical protein
MPEDFFLALEATPGPRLALRAKVVGVPVIRRVGSAAGPALVKLREDFATAHREEKNVVVALNVDK